MQDRDSIGGADMDQSGCQPQCEDDGPKTALGADAAPDPATGKKRGRIPPAASQKIQKGLTTAIVRLPPSPKNASELAVVRDNKNKATIFHIITPTAICSQCIPAILATAAHNSFLSYLQQCPIDIQFDIQ